MSERLSEQSQCQVCEARSQLWLCSRCQADLRKMLVSLAGDNGLLANLEETALGQARIGEQARWHRDTESPMALNIKASELLTYARSVLVEWTRDLCETRGVEIPMLSTTADIAGWLAENVSAIAGDEGAAVAFKEFDGLVRDIIKMIDLPVPQQFCGTCPTLLDAHGQRCGTALLAKREATEVICSVCKQTHDVRDVIAQAVEDLGEWSFTAYELQIVVLPALREPVPAATFRSWIHRRQLIPARFRRLDGTSGMVRESPADKPEYRLKDVRGLRDQKARAKIGAKSA